MTRRALLGGLAVFTAAAATSAATPAFAKTPALLTGAGDFRHLSLVNQRTGEWLNTVYWIEGEYIPEALDGVNHILRDWRQEKVFRIDRRTIDILSAAQRLLETPEPLEVLSGYRTASTNRMLRKRSRSVARNSYHIKGMAADITLKSRSISQLARAGKSLGAGGVGKYSRSDFVHLDSGPVRSWGR